MKDNDDDEEGSNNNNNNSNSPIATRKVHDETCDNKMKNNNNMNNTNSSTTNIITITTNSESQLENVEKQVKKENQTSTTTTTEAEATESVAIEGETEADPLLLPFHFEVLHWDKKHARFLYCETSKVTFSEIIIGPNVNSRTFIDAIDKIIKSAYQQIVSNDQICYFLCKNIQVITNDLHSFAVLLGVDLSAYNSFFQYFYCDSEQTWTETLHKLENGETIHLDDLQSMKVSQTYEAAVNWSQIDNLDSEAGCTLLCKLNTCKDQELNEVGKLFRGLKIISGGICPLINRHGSGSRSQDMFIAFADHKNATFAHFRGQLLCSETNSMLLSCSIVKNDSIKSLFKDVHSDCRKLCLAMNRQRNALIRIKGLNFQTTSTQLCAVIRKEVPNLPCDLPEFGVIMPLRGPQQTLKTGDAFVLCTNTAQALLLKQKFAHFNYDQRSWEVYLSSPAEMIQIYKAHQNGEFITRNKRSNPFTTSSGGETSSGNDKMISPELLFTRLDNNNSLSNVPSLVNKNELTNITNSRIGLPLPAMLPTALPISTNGNMFMSPFSAASFLPSPLYHNPLSQLSLMPNSTAAWNLSPLGQLLVTQQTNLQPWIPLPLLTSPTMLPFSLSQYSHAPGSLLWNESSNLNNAMGSDHIIDPTSALLFYPYSCNNND